MHLPVFSIYAPSFFVVLCIYHVLRFNTFAISCQKKIKKISILCLGDEDINSLSNGYNVEIFRFVKMSSFS